MPILSTLRTRMSLATIIAVGVLSALGLTSADADQIGEKNNGPAGDYAGTCGGKTSDPVGIVFRGRASVMNTRETIAERTGWGNRDTGFTVFGFRLASDKQGLSVRHSDGKYSCEENGMAIASAGGANDRTHVRLWRAFGQSGSVVTVGTPHHEDFVEHSGFPGGDHCEILPGFGIGNHAVDEGGVRQDKSSGFDKGRKEVADAFRDAGHEVTTEQWGNTAEFKQCDEDWAGSNGVGVTVVLDHAMHAYARPATGILKNAARLNGELITDETQTEFWWGYGKRHAQGVGGYERTTTPKTVSGPQQITTSVPISGLGSGSVYYFRMFARNQEGVVQEGPELEFKTCGASLNEPQGASNPRAIASCHGTVDVFYRTPSGELGHDWFDTGGSGWRSGNLPGPVESEPAAVAQLNGTVDVFFGTPSGELGHDWFDTGGSGWHSGNLTDLISSAPQATAQNDGTVDVFYRTPSGELGHSWFDTGGLGWQFGNLPGTIAAPSP